MRIARSHPTTLLSGLVCCAALAGAPPAQAQDEGGGVGACLAAWGQHPFGANPEYRTLATSVKVFGFGRSSGDREVTDKPALIVVNPGVNVMGGTTTELLNPNGWYCLRTTVNVMGGMKFRADCSAHLANTSGQVLKNGEEKDKAISVLGSVEVERVGCNS